MLAGCSYPDTETSGLDARPVVNGTATGALLITESDATRARSAQRKLNLIDLQGRLVASVTAAPHGLVTCDDPYNTMPMSAAYQRVDVYLPWTSTSSDRVYYLDGDSEVRYLGVAGDYGRARILPGGPSKGLVFAVSPNDERIAVGLLDYSVWPVKETLYVEDMQGGDRVTAQGFDGYYWPVGWHDGKVVLEGLIHDYGYLGTVSFGHRTPRGIPDSYRLFDPATGLVGPALGPVGCSFDGSLPSPAGLVCGANNHLYGVGWDGSARLFMDVAVTGGGSLSFDGSRIAACCFAGARIAFVKPGADPELTNAKGYVSDGGWVDATHVAYRVAGSPDFAILDTATGAITAPLTLVDQRILQRLPAAL